MAPLHALPASLLPTVAALFVFTLAVFMRVAQADDDRDHKDIPKPHVEWVPIVGRSGNAVNAVEDALRQSSPDYEKVQRISKMLNSSIALQQRELKEGTEKLKTLKQVTSDATSVLHSSSSLQP
ncbi:hypothetical protein AAVH_32872 [Aphelenchoides avenae]|nr:hypothetical protein AAVH_32872 [Aphelenchus avenae]